MQCTSCKAGTLVEGNMDQLFRAHTCSHCGGNWILIEDFVAWKDNHPNYPFSTSLLFSEADAVDTPSAMLCPDSGVLMQRYRMSARHNHRLDYSATVGGIWLDKGEWELLKSEGLAGSLNSILTLHWQKKLKNTTAKEAFTELYQGKFGDEDYSRVKEIRAWLNSHPRKADVRAYLLATDPYSAER
ncbi:zf-TFIIB domain-containing protein [Pokkaliibacter sp. CJK22405]|uniref:TFIIB-type zinc ribbon-containing protein n=1 Tax=Pokkaliibacter sp. CJK22405 TaxID=3384615 RepID=UPI00398566DA